MQQGLNFLAFRDQIYEWTLQSDQNLFNQVTQLTQYIFSTQKAINENVILTKANLNENSTILNNNFNHYLRLSENKFTQNKIGEPLKNHQEKSQAQQKSVSQPKSKMDIYKEALGLSIKNLQIKQNDNQQDNISVSQLSLSQAIFKNTRLPPTFGSKQFRAQKFLNLFFDEDLNESIISKKQIDNQSIRSSQPLSSPSQNTNSNQNILPNFPPAPSLNNINLPPPPPINSLNLPPPPSLNSLNLPPPPPINSLNLPPPPPLNLLNLPPPPSINNMNLNPISLDSKKIVQSAPQIQNNRKSQIFIQQQDPNKTLLQSIMQSTRNNNYSRQSRNNLIDEQQNLKNKQSEEINPKVTSKNKQLTFQQELALKLKFGKQYKHTPIINNENNKQVSFQQNQLFSKQEIKSNIKIQQNKPKQIKKSNQLFQSNHQQQQHQQQNALFGGNKKKNSNNLSNQNNKFAINKNQSDAIMGRKTFNQEMLFKKKPIFSKQTVIPATNNKRNQEVQEDKIQNLVQYKKIQKKPNRNSMLFNQNSDQQDDFIFKKKSSKKITKEQQPEINKKQQNPNNNSLMTSKMRITKKQQPIKKKANNKLFGDDSDEDEDKFIQKKTPQNKNQKPENIVNQQTQKTLQVNQKSQKKKNNSIFANDQEQEDFKFKKKKNTQINITKNLKQNQYQIQKITAIEVNPMISMKNQVKKINQQQLMIKDYKRNQITQIQDLKQQKFNQQIILQKNLQKNTNTLNEQQNLVVQKQTKTLLEKDEINNQINIDQGKQQSQNKILSLRRRKNKPKNTVKDFDQQQQKINQKPPLFQKQQQKQQVQYQEVISNQNQKMEEKRDKQSYAAKMSRMGMAGMGMPGMSSQIGLGPLIPKGMIITKPSEAKKIQKQALQRIKNEENQRKLIQQQENQNIKQQLEKKKQKQKIQKKQQQEQQIKKIKREEQNKIYLQKQEEQEKKQKQYLQSLLLKRIQQQQIKRIQQIQQSKKRIQYEKYLQKQQQIKLKQDKQRKLNEQYEKKEVFDKQKSKLPLVNTFNNQKKQKNTNPLIKDKNSLINIPKLPPKNNPLINTKGSGGNLNGPLGGPLGGPLSGAIKKSNNDKGIVPSISVAKKQIPIKSNQNKKSLFDDDQQQQYMQKKKQTILSKTGYDNFVEKKQQNSLFNGDQDNFSLKAKQRQNKKKGLFEAQDDDQSIGFSKKQKKTLMLPQQNKNIKSQKNNLNQKKAIKKGLFDNDSDDQDISKIKTKQNQKQPIKQTYQSQINVKKQQPNEKKLPLVKQNNKKKKKGLFNQSDNEQEIVIKRPQKKQVGKNIKGLFGESDDQEIQFGKKTEQKIQKSQQRKQKQLLQNKLDDQAVNYINNQTKKVNNTQLLNIKQTKQKKKNNIFGSSQEQFDNNKQINKNNNLSMKPRQKILNKPLISTQREQNEISLQKAKTRQGIHQQQYQQTFKPENNNRKLFDSASDDSEDQQMERKKRMAVKKLKGFF